MVVQCLSLLASILQAESVYFGWEEERDRDRKLGSCLEVTLCLLAVTFLERTFCFCRPNMYLGQSVKVEDRLKGLVY